MPPPNHSSNKGNDDINFRAIVPVAIDLDLLEKEKKNSAQFLLYGKFHLDTSDFIVRIKMYNEEHYENKAVKTITITPTYVEANRIFLEIPVDKLIDSIAKVDLSYDNGKTYTNEAHNFSITHTKFVEILRISPLAWSIQGGTKVRIVAKPLYRLRTPIKYIRIRITYLLFKNDEKTFDSIVITPDNILGCNLEFSSPIIPLKTVDSIVSLEISLNGGMTFSQHFNIAVVYDGLPVEVEHINPNRGKVAGGTKIQVTLPSKSQFLLNRLFKATFVGKIKDRRQVVNMVVNFKKEVGLEYRLNKIRQRIGETIFNHTYNKSYSLKVLMNCLHAENLLFHSASKGNIVNVICYTPEWPTDIVTDVNIIINVNDQLKIDSYIDDVGNLIKSSNVSNNYCIYQYVPLSNVISIEPKYIPFDRETKVKVFVSSGHENKKKVKIRLVDTSTNKYLSVDGFSRSNNTNMFIANIPKMEKTFMLKLRVVHFDMIGNASKDIISCYSNPILTRKSVRWIDIRSQDYIRLSGFHLLPFNVRLSGNSCFNVQIKLFIANEIENEKTLFANEELAMVHGKARWATPTDYKYGNNSNNNKKQQNNYDMYDSIIEFQLPQDMRNMPMIKNKLEYRPQVISPTSTSPLSVEETDVLLIKAKVSFNGIHWHPLFGEFNTSIKKKNIRKKIAPALVVGEQPSIRSVDTIYSGTGSILATVSGNGFFDTNYITVKLEFLNAPSIFSSCILLNATYKSNKTVFVEIFPPTWLKSLNSDSYKQSCKFSVSNDGKRFNDRAHISTITFETNGFLEMQQEKAFALVQHAIAEGEELARNNPPELEQWEKILIARRKRDGNKTVNKSGPIKPSFDKAAYINNLNQSIAKRPNSARVSSSRKQFNNRGRRNIIVNKTSNNKMAKAKKLHVGFNSSGKARQDVRTWRSQPFFNVNFDVEDEVPLVASWYTNKEEEQENNQGEQQSEMKAKKKETKGTFSKSTRADDPTQKWIQKEKTNIPGPGAYHEVLYDTYENKAPFNSKSTRTTFDTKKKGEIPGSWSYNTSKNIAMAKRTKFETSSFAKSIHKDRFGRPISKVLMDRQKARLNGPHQEFVRKNSLNQREIDKQKRNKNLLHADKMIHWASGKKARTTREFRLDHKFNHKHHHELASMKNQTFNVMASICENLKIQQNVDLTESYNATTRLLRML